MSGARVFAARRQAGVVVALTSVERLQPSLLDRLIDDEPGRQVESLDKQFLSPSRFRETVRRDLAWLLNATALSALQDLSAHPEAERSTLNFGIPELAGRTASSVDQGALVWAIREAICAFEPRLLPDSLRVEMVADSSHGSPNVMRLRIEGELWSQPLPLRLCLRAELNLEDGEARVTEVAPE